MIGLAFFLVALMLVGYACRTAYLDWNDTWIDVKHKYDGRPAGPDTYYVVTCPTRKEARRVVREARKEPLITDLHVEVCPPGYRELFCS